MTTPTPPSHLELAAHSHPDPTVRQAGFDLTHPYLERCWAPIIGPSAVLLLRRLPTLWLEHEPYSAPADELARSLGLGAAAGGHGRFNRTLDRLAAYHLAEWHDPGRSLSVYLEVAPLTQRQLAKVPDWTIRAHDELLGEHLDTLSRAALDRVTERSFEPDRGQLAHRLLRPTGNATGTLGR